MYKLPNPDEREGRVWLLKGGSNGQAAAKNVWGGGKERGNSTHKKEKAHRRGGGERGGVHALGVQGEGEKKRAKEKTGNFWPVSRRPYNLPECTRIHIGYPTDTCLTGVLLG